MSFPEIIYNFRMKHGLSQSQLGKIINASIASICNWENGKYKIRTEKRMKVESKMAEYDEEYKITPFSVMEEQSSNDRKKRNLKGVIFKQEGRIPLHKLVYVLFKNGERVMITKEVLAERIVEISPYVEEYQDVQLTPLDLLNDIIEDNKTIQEKYSYDGEVK